MTTTLPALSTIGIMGGGQLGRMLATSAAQLGYQVHIYAPEERSPAAHVAQKFICAPWDDDAALTDFAKTCDVITYEFENVPVNALEKIRNLAPLRPGPDALAITQSRIKEKDFVSNLGGRTAPYIYVTKRAELDEAVRSVGPHAIIKSDRMGYDGKGQSRVKRGSDLDAAWAEAGQGPCLVEGLVRFEHEFSMILVRSQEGEVRFWDAPENIHKDGILSQSIVPAPDAVEIHIPAARALARKIANELDYVGVLAVEFFATDKGPVFNEMAPRVHNSGHWTIEGARTSQFENHIRAICGLPLGDTSLACASVMMENLLGEDIMSREGVLCDPRASFHHYGKREARPGRKMGHVTRVTI